VSVINLAKTHVLGVNIHLVVAEKLSHIFQEIEVQIVRAADRQRQAVRQDRVALADTVEYLLPVSTDAHPVLRRYFHESRCEFAAVKKLFGKVLSESDACCLVCPV